MMARRKKPKITGRDPEYTSATHQFAKLPTHKGDDAVDAPNAPTPQTSQQAESKPIQEAEPATKKPKPSKPRPKKAPAVAPATKAAATETHKSIDPEATRRVELLAALTPELDRKLKALETIGIAYKDAMSMAGRRATKEFQAAPEYVEKIDVERLPTAKAYRSSKSLPISVLETLHDAANPLRLASDGAMVRGQFEPLFWQHLETVLSELNDKYSK